jgi:hypothetical protein
MHRADRYFAPDPDQLADPLGLEGTFDSLREERRARGIVGYTREIGNLLPPSYYPAASLDIIKLLK